MFNRRCMVAAVLAATVALGACGEGDRGGSVKSSDDSTGTTATTETATTPGASGGSPVATVKVRETEYELDPKDPDVAKAGLVRFQVRNAGKITHALEVEGPDGEAKTKGIEPGKSATLEVDLSKPGTYEWYCPIADHKERGMKGEIKVAGGGSGAAKKREDSGKGHDESGNGDDQPGKQGGGSGRRGDGSGRRGDGTGGGTGSY